MTFDQKIENDKEFISVVSQLEAEDSDDRRWAVYSLERYDPTLTTDYLVQAVQDDNRAVREAASEVLENINPELCVKKLVPLLGSIRIEVRNIVAAILVSFGDAAVDDLLPAFTFENEDVRKFAADILGLAGSDKAISVLSKAALEDDVENVVVSAVEALGKIGSVKALPALYHLFDNEPSFQVESAEAIGLISGAEASSFLETRLMKSDNQLVNFAIIDALGNIGELSSLSLLMSYIKNIPPILKEHICRAILKIGRHKNVNVLNSNELSFCDMVIGYLDENQDDLTDLVSYQISLRPDNEVLIKLMDRANDLPSTLVVALINSVNKEKGFINSLSKLVNHKDDWVAYSAIEALGNFDKNSIKDTILNTLRDNRDLPVIAAIRTSLQLELEEAKPVLQVLTESENEDVRGEALQALHELDNS